MLNVSSSAFDPKRTSRCLAPLEPTTPNDKLGDVKATLARDRSCSPAADLGAWPGNNITTERRNVVFILVYRSLWPAQLSLRRQVRPSLPTTKMRPPGQNIEIRQPEASPLTSTGFCQALAAAAAANDLPVNFFTRLIWQESRFNPDSVSRAGAQGIAQFMPGTARRKSLEDPFNPREAIAKSAQLLRDLHREFGNLGLAAAAYNAGPGRVRDWLAAHRLLPAETRAYVRLVTGRLIEEWTNGQNISLNLAAAKDLPCDRHAEVPIPPNSALATSQKTATPKPWGVEVVGGPTSAKALARYREWLPKYAAIVADREPKLVVRGIIGRMGAVHVRVATDTRGEADKVCAQLRAADAYCEVLRD
jgi:hypothetical protein